MAGGRCKSKFELEGIYKRVIKVCKSDPDLTGAQLIQRFGIGHEKALELKKIALKSNHTQMEEKK